MAKRKTNKTGNSSKILEYIAWILAVVALILSSLVAGYYFGFQDAKAEFNKTKDKEKEQRLALIKKIESSVDEVKEKSVSARLKEVLKKDTVTYISASHELDDNSFVNEEKEPEREMKHTAAKAKLSIIIDDVGTKSQVEAIKKINLPLTMSFLPPSKYRPNTPTLAAKEKFYMVHLPMEAQNFSAEEPITLRVHDSQSVVSSRIQEIKEYFPKVEYINNHTGSKFTSDEVAMNRLIFALNTNKIHFVDSRTTSETMAPKVLKNFGLKYVSRDVFLDHEMEKEYVVEQIKKAIKVAKAHGTAIAIGHPHKNTLEAIYESKKLFKDVDLVYVDKIY